MGPQKLMTINEVAAYLRVEPRTVQRYMQSGKLRYGRTNRTVRFRREWVDAFLDRNFDSEEAKSKAGDPSFS